MLIDGCLALLFGDLALAFRFGLILPGLSLIAIRLMEVLVGAERLGFGAVSLREGCEGERNDQGDDSRRDGRRAEETLSIGFALPAQFGVGQVLFHPLLAENAFVDSVADLQFAVPGARDARKPQDGDQC